MSIGPVQWSTTCVIALLAVLMLTGCGDEPAEESTAESTEDNALSSVCDAGDLTEIKYAQANLSDDRQAKVETANQAFAATATSTPAELGASLSAGEAEAALTSATQELAGSYRDTFAPIDCS